MYADTPSKGQDPLYDMSMMMMPVSLFAVTFIFEYILVKFTYCSQLS